MSEESDRLDEVKVEEEDVANAEEALKNDEDDDQDEGSLQLNVVPGVLLDSDADVSTVWLNASFFADVVLCSRWRLSLLHLISFIR